MIDLEITYMPFDYLLEPEEAAEAQGEGMLWSDELPALITF